ncbi:amidohydrolase [bacterium]|nr:amidohydrolase [bacterium]
MRRTWIFLAVALITLSLCSCRESAVRKHITKGVAAIRLIDSHEHLAPEKDCLAQERSLFTTLHYAASDMWADGLDRNLSDSLFENPTVPLEQKWSLMAPYWNNIRHTAYSRSLLIAFKDLYGIGEITDSTYAKLSEKIKEANQEGFYSKVLHDKAGIDLAICDVGLSGRDLDSTLFRAVLRLDEFVLESGSVDAVCRKWGFQARSLEDWERGLDMAFQKTVDWGFVGIKSGLAYERSLSYSYVSRDQAATAFEHILADSAGTRLATYEDRRAIQDYMFGRIADNCARYDLPLQIHTGLFYDTGRDISQSDPTRLAPFIIRHPRTRFVLMHCGYPYGEELLAMAKNLPNVTLDMCWIYIISPRFAAEFLDRAIETLPSDKVLGFGGDYVVAEGSYGHSVLCRQIVSKVLADRVIEGFWSEEEALDYAKALLRDNAIKTFKLKI